MEQMKMDMLEELTKAMPSKIKIVDVDELRNTSVD